MSSDIEQIGALQYATNPDYPYPFPVERPPHFWMTEQTGRLAEVVEAYLDDERLLPEQVALIKEYLRQYVERALLTGDANRPKLLQELATLKNNRDITRYAEVLADVGIEPF
jgi:hypothetical protein